MCVCEKVELFNLHIYRLELKLYPAIFSARPLSISRTKENFWSNFQVPTLEISAPEVQLKIHSPSFPALPKSPPLSHLPRLQWEKDKIFRNHHFTFL